MKVVQHLVSSRLILQAIQMNCTQVRTHPLYQDTECLSLTAESGSAGAHVSAGHVLTGASVHTRVGQALVDVDVTVAARPAGLAHALIAVDLVLAVAVDTGVAGTLAVLREAGGVTETLGTDAGEAGDPIDAGATVMARVQRAVVDVDVTH